MEEFTAYEVLKDILNKRSVIKCEWRRINKRNNL